MKTMYHVLEIKWSQKLQAIFCKAIGNPSASKEELFDVLRGVINPGLKSTILSELHTNVTELDNIIIETLE